MKQNKSQLFRVSPNLNLYWQKGRLFLDDWHSHKRASVAPKIIKALDAFASPCTLEEGRRKSGLDKNDFSLVFPELKKRGFIIDSEMKRAEDWVWEFPAKAFFFGTKDTFSAMDGSPEPELENFDKTTQPSLYKTYPDAKVIKLKKVKIDKDFLARKTVRKFSRKPMKLALLNKILLQVWGQHGFIKTKAFGNLIRKTSPSAGARHPIEVYPIVFNVDGLSPGIYHYNVRDNSMEMLKQANLRHAIGQLAARQTWISGASVAFVMTAVFNRTAWKYKSPRGLRMIFSDQGHLSMSLYLTCSRNNLGCALTKAFYDSKLEELIEIDGINESALSIHAVGFPA